MERKIIINTILNKVALFLLVFSIFFVSFEVFPLKTTTIWLLGILLIIVNIIFFKETLNLKDKNLFFLGIIDIILILLSFFANNFFVAIKFIILFSSAVFVFCYYKDHKYLYNGFMKLILLFSKIFAYFTILSVFFEKLYFKIINIIFSASRVEIIKGLYEQGCYSGIAGQTGTNSFLLSIGIIALCSLLFINHSNNKKRSIYRLYSLLLLLTALILCNKRAITLIIIVLMLFIVVISNIGKKRKEKTKNYNLYAGVIFFMMFLMVGFPNTFRLLSRSIDYFEVTNNTEIKNKPTGGDVSNNSENLVNNVLNGRGELYKQAVKYFVHNPLVGIGIDNYTYYENIQTHNSILQLLAEIGLIGTMPLIILIIYFFIITFKYLKNNLENNIYIFAFCSEALILLYSLTGNPFHDFNQRNYYFIIMAIIFGIINCSNENKKTGILTFHNSQNYGAVLQTYALNKKLKDSEIINYYSKPVYDFYKPLNIKKYGNVNFMNFLKTIYSFKKSIFKKYVFDYFRNNNLECSELIDDKEYMIINCNKYKKIITGSDQVWNSNITKNDDYIYFLNFETKAKKYSYAASIGSSNITNAEKDNLKNNIKDYEIITVREDSAKETLDSLGINSEVIIDPTLLLTQSEWDEITIDSKFDQDYIFVYCLEDTEKFKNIVNSASKKYKLPIVHLGNKNVYENELANFPYGSPNLFITLLKNSKYVITNSFHGTALSIIYNKIFISIPHSTRGTRQSNLLNKLGLSERLTNDIDILKKEYKNSKLAKYREEGLKFIEELNKND